MKTEMSYAFIFLIVPKCNLTHSFSSYLPKLFPYKHFYFQYSDVYQIVQILLHRRPDRWHVHTAKKMRLILNKSKPEVSQ